MKKRLLISLFLFIFILALLTGCKNNTTTEIKEDIIINKESTLIDTDKKVSDYGEDYKSVLYAYLYNFYNKLESIRYDVEGTIKAKILFIDYNVAFDSYTLRKSNVTYSEDHSHSIFMNVDTIRYQTKTKIIENTDSKNDKVYDYDEYQKISYSDFQPLLLGFICNDTSILSATLVESKEDTYTIKYTFDPNESTAYIKKATKTGGDLKDYPEYINIQLVVTMKNDYTPVEIISDFTYNATKPLLGSGLVTQHAVTSYSLVNEDLVIENENKYIALLGEDTEVIDIEEKVSDELIDAFRKLDFDTGVELKGKIESEILSNIDTDIIIDLDLNLKTNLDDLKEEIIYKLASLYGEVNLNDGASSLIGLVSSIFSNDIGEYSELLTNLSTLKTYYIGDGKLYLEALDSNCNTYNIIAIKLIDIIDELASIIKFNDVESLINDDSSINEISIEKEIINNDQISYKLVLSDELLSNLEESIDEILNAQEMVKSLLSYDKIDEIKFSIDTKDGLPSKILGHISYLNEDQDKINLINIDLSFLESIHEYKEDFKVASDYDSYLKGLDLLNNINYLLDNFHIDYMTKDAALELIEEYEELDEIAKRVIDHRISTLSTMIEHLDSDIENLFIVGSLLSDIEAIDNDGIYKLCLAYDNIYNSLEVRKALGEDLLEKFNGISEYVDYYDFENDLANIDYTTDVSLWGLTNEKINNYKSLFRICNINTNIKIETFSKLGIMGIIYMDTIITKILEY